MTGSRVVLIGIGVLCPPISENDNVDILVDLLGTFRNVATVTGV